MFSHMQETEGTDKHTLRLWLIGAASRLSDVDSSRVWRRVACLLPAGGHCDTLTKACCLQLLELVCEVDPAKVTLQSTQFMHVDHILLAICAEQADLGLILMVTQVGHLLSLHPRIVRYFFQGKLCVKALSSCRDVAQA